MELSIKGVKKGAILITGASSGIGKATALYLSHRGYHVFAGVRKEQQAEDLTKETSSEIQPVILDVTQRDQILAVIDRISDYTRSTRTGLVGVINNAGIAISGPLEFIPQEQLREQFQVSVFGQLAVVQAAYAEAPHAGVFGQRVQSHLLASSAQSWDRRWLPVASSSRAG
jgi:NAD(P)-dependent dehydrogenase (short-subunit alcohol dehydrogenase family)